MSDKNIISADFNITKKDFTKTFWRSFTLLGSYNFERMEALGYDYSIMHILRKIYPDNKKFSEALLRHMEVFNMTVAPSTFVMGISIAMEEQNAKNPDFDTSSINAIKLALMGPLSGIGDTFFWGIFRILAASIGVSFALQGSILAPFIFLLLFNIPHFLVRYYGLYIGYSNGNDFLRKIEEDGQMSLFTYCAGIVGIVAVAAMIATQISITCPLQLEISGSTIVIQDYINQLLPQFLPLMFTLIVYAFLKKKTNVTLLMLGLIVVGFVLGILGIIA